MMIVVEKVLCVVVRADVWCGVAVCSGLMHSRAFIQHGRAVM
jgi:hypothetical protein